MRSLARCPREEEDERIFHYRSDLVAFGGHTQSCLGIPRRGAALRCRNRALASSRRWACSLILWMRYRRALDNHHLHVWIKACQESIIVFVKG